MQNTVGFKKGSEESMSMLETALELKEKGGLGIFYDGITPKLIRASLNHGVTFYLYDNIMALGGGSLGTH
jgi:Mitochondrial carrier protein